MQHPAHAELVSRQPDYPWNYDDWLTTMAPPEVPGMLTWEEQRLLVWLAARFYGGHGRILDCGCFCGLSTLCLGRGLELNSGRGAWRGPLVHAYDLFRVINDAYTLQVLGPSYRPGDSFLPVFRRNTAAVSHWIQEHPGNIHDATWSATPIEILFIDVAKSWRTNHHLQATFFPALLPGRSVVVHQDYHNPHVPWIHIQMEYFADAFEAIADQKSTKVYLLKRALTPAETRLDLRRDLSPADRRDLLRRALERASPASRPFLEGSLGMLLFTEGDLATARAHLQSALARHAGQERATQPLREVLEMVEFWKDGPALERDMETKFERPARVPPPGLPVVRPGEPRV